VDGEGRVTEGTSSNAWIITGENEVITRQADRSILNGVTRVGLIELLQQAGLRLVERPFTVAEAKGAREAFLTSTTNFVLPVVRIDDVPVGEGKPGPVVAKLRDTYVSYTTQQGIGR
jgi:D-alanine transaminase